mmetsp:Transcript_7566/g.12648  ORF Transcript_7566/g.12648 Transcript_7566/m.12648 type:complete len:413 (-) Transcript_7566:175-1413(-)
MPPSFSAHQVVAKDPSRHRVPCKGVIRKMTVDVLKTYKYINQVYYATRKRRAHGNNRSTVAPKKKGEEEYILDEGDVIDTRFVILKPLGSGSFGQVFKAYDRNSEKYVAIKIIKDEQKYSYQAQNELEILLLLNKSDPKDENHLVRLKEHFMYRQHYCMVFELLSHSLYSLLRNSGFRGVSLNLIRRFTSQILKALSFLGQPNINIVHCDIKPENILLEDLKHSAIKLVDFGSACHTDKPVFTYIQSRFYRSPEVMLGMAYDRSIDMWSLGCMLVELHTGQPLFDGQNEWEQIVKMCEVLGLPAAEILTRGTKARNYFSNIGSGRTPRLRVCPTLPEAEPGSRPLIGILGVTTHGPRGMYEGHPGHSTEDYIQFWDFVRKCLEWNPRQRLMPLVALDHLFLAGSHQTEISLR